jgi:hypothetical protein
MSYQQPHQRGLSTSRATALEHAPNPHRPEHQEKSPHRAFPPLSISVRRPAAASMTYGRDVVDPPGRSLTPMPHPSAPKNKRRTAKKRSKAKSPGLGRVDRTRSFRDDCQPRPAPKPDHCDVEHS